MTNKPEPSPTPATCPTCGSADRHVRNLAPPDAMWQTHCSDPWHEPPTPAGAKCKHCGKPKYLHREDNLACRWASEGKGGWSETYHYLPEVTQNVTEPQPPQPAPHTTPCYKSNCPICFVEQPAPAVGAREWRKIIDEWLWAELPMLRFAIESWYTCGEGTVDRWEHLVDIPALRLEQKIEEHAAHVTAADKASTKAGYTGAGDWLRKKFGDLALSGNYTWNALVAHMEHYHEDMSSAKEAEIAERDWMIDQMAEAYDIIRLKWEQAESALKEAQKELDLRTISWNSALKGEGDNFQEILRLRSKLATLREKVSKLEPLLTVILVDTINAWDKDQDSRVGKMLCALNGQVKNYRKDITEFREILRELAHAPGCVV